MDIKPENRFTFPTIYFANARSINNKKEELEQEIRDAHADIAIITETWLHSDIASNLFHIEGYEFIRNDRETRQGGGVAVYIRSDIPFKRWICCEENTIETVWVTLRPPKLPRDVTHIAIACVYHPTQANHRDLKDHLSRGFDFILTKHPGTGLAAIGDFNKFPDYHLTSQHGLKQLVKAATREKSTLDKCYMNMHKYYVNPEIRSHLGKSDHLAVLLNPNKQSRHNTGALKKGSPGFKARTKRLCLCTSYKI